VPHERRTPTPRGEHHPAPAVALSVHLCHKFLGSPGRPHLRPDLLTQQRLAEPAAPPWGRAEGAEKWHKVAVFGAFFEHPYTIGSGEV
jgi:hypothetical protein